MTNVFEKRRTRLNAMKQLYGSYLPPEQLVTCARCGQENPRIEVESSLCVCPSCGFHQPIPAALRLAMVMDEGKWRALDAGVQSADPLSFPGYGEKLAEQREKTGMQEAVLTAAGMIGGRKCVVGVMDSRFLMGSMGTAVGEKITRAIEYATRRRLPLILFCASGGARMQEGVMSLMQMAKTSAALKRHSDRGLLYITVLTNPTTGGVTASFASLGDVILAEPGALIGFAGPRVIEQTIGEKLPEDFQRAEFMMQHGFVDAVIHRRELRHALGRLLMLHDREGNTCPNS